jgi:hypothetical protein
VYVELYVDKSGRETDDRRQDNAYFLVLPFKMFTGTFRSAALNSYNQSTEPGANGATSCSYRIRSKNINKSNLPITKIFPYQLTSTDYRSVKTSCAYYIANVLIT